MAQYKAKHRYHGYCCRPDVLNSRSGNWGEKARNGTKLVCCNSGVLSIWVTAGEDPYQRTCTSGYTVDGSEYERSQPVTIHNEHQVSSKTWICVTRSPSGIYVYSISKYLNMEKTAGDDDHTNF